MSNVDKYIVGEASKKTGLVTHLETKTKFELITIMSKAATLVERGAAILRSGEIIETKGRALNAEPLEDTGVKLTATGCIVVAARGKVILDDTNTVVKEYLFPEVA